MNADDNPTRQPMRPLVQQLGAILWPSFFAAMVAAAIFFALVDPIRLAEISFPGAGISRGFGYTIGFFLLWLATASASSVTWLLLKPVTRNEERYPLE